MVPKPDYKWVGKQYNPAYVAWWGLVNLNVGNYEPFERAVEWLHEKAGDRLHATVWEYSFDWVEGKALLKAPWISAISQGLAISALIRSWRLRGRTKDLSLAQRAAEVFWTPVERGGLLDLSEGSAFLEEYPARPFTRVMDGFCFALLALYDLKEEFNKQEKYQILFEQGVDTLEAFLPTWDYNGRWSWYGREGFLCSIQYHTLNRVMLQVFYQLTRRGALKSYSDRWDPSNLNTLNRTLIRFVAFWTLTLRRWEYNKIRNAYYG